MGGVVQKKNLVTQSELLLQKIIKSLCHTNYEQEFLNRIFKYYTFLGIVNLLCNLCQCCFFKKTMTTTFRGCGGIKFVLRIEF